MVIDYPINTKNDYIRGVSRFRIWFCLTVASVMTGFFYNTEIFKELKLEPPKTEEALFELLETVQKSGKYLPLAFGTKDAWQSAQVLLSGMGLNHWGGE
jgi:raffinose/stachyose/melibiose transport system substrate-binding protein